MISISSDAMFANYTPRRDSFDECVAADGNPRPAWRPLVQYIDSLGRDAFERMVAEGAAMARESGTTYNAVEEEGELTRPWELTFIPLVIQAAAWNRLETALKQRVRILEAVLDDLLGPQRLLRERVLPVELLLNNTEFLRTYHGLPKVGGVRLHIVATDLARDQVGSWWVTGDRTRAPSGLGYLVENRIVTSRSYTRLIRQSHIRRLAPFFMRLRQLLESLAPRPTLNPRVAILTPGQKSYRYFEDTYLARYLGYTLVQGRDLAVRGGALNLKTLGGLLPIDVLWRHVSDEQCDPLELDPAAIEGVTGLLQTVRNGSVAVANCLGSKLAQTPALLPFIPAASRFLLGEEPMLPTVPTYWCGRPDDLHYVLHHLDSLKIRPAYGIRADRPTRPIELSSAAREELVAAIQAHPHQYIAQVDTPRSTTPVWQEGKLQPWYVALRTFQLQTTSGVDVLPGGLVRVSPTTEGIDHSHGAVQQLGQDCWIIADEPVDPSSTLLPSPDQPLKLVRGGAELPSRVAENLFWLGRYSERAEAIARLLRTAMVRLSGEQSGSSLPEMPRLLAALAAIGQIEPGYAVEGLSGTLLGLDEALPRSLYSVDQQRGLSPSVAAMADKATAVRDRISLDAYRIVRRVQDELTQNMSPDMPVDARTAINRLSRLITELLAFAGLGQESITRTLGWRFLQLGRRIERAWQTAELLRATLVNSLPRRKGEPVKQTDERPILEAVLEACDSVMTYRSRYLLRLEPAATLDLLITDDTNPRSILFQLERIAEVMDRLPMEADEVAIPPDRRTAFELLHAVRMSQPAELAKQNSAGTRQSLDRLLETLTERLPELSNDIAARYLIHTTTAQALTGQTSG
ncbi:MAG: circularly permuted type 2 ATP-grasp protein [Planctomycetaceae bacterium]